MKKRKNLKYHELGGKENLVTLSDRHGTYDKFLCVNCGKEFRIESLAWPKKIYESCYVSETKYNKVMERRKAEAGGEVYGGWMSPNLVHKCGACDSELVICPREGHFNSKFWQLERDDGMVLFICPKECPIEE
jgi:hypothetical protein